MHQGLAARAEQELRLLPRMLQRLEVLQLPALELEDWLRAAAESNEALLVDGPDFVPAPGAAARRASDDHDALLQAQPARSGGLAEHVEQQLAFAGFAPELEAWVRFLAGCIDGAGFLSLADEELLELARAEGLSGGAGRLGSAIAALQSLEPKGIGARDAVEALLLQLDPRDPEYAQLCRLLEDFLEELARNKLPAVARATGLGLPRLQRLLATLARLDPRPAAGLVEEAAQVLRPELCVEREGAGFEVRPTGAGLPQARVDPRVRACAADPAAPAELRRHLRERVVRARWIVEALALRESTLLRVARAVFEHQRAFLEEGARARRPLRMGAVAEELGLHLSTVSRAVAGKHVQTPWGIFALRSFFPAPAEPGGESARDELREALRALVAAEDPERPLSDEELVAALEACGHAVARRTVAKHRQELGIASSYRRRRY